MILPTVTLEKGLGWRVLGSADLESIVGLHRRSIAGMDLQAVKRQTPGLFSSILNGRGQILGVMENDRLIAYGVLQHDLLKHSNPCDALGLPAATTFIKLAGAAVDHGWRRKGIQRALIEARARFANAYGVIFSTAAPINLPSWTNLLACGFAVRKIQFLFGEHPRFLMVRPSKELYGSTPDLDHPGEDVDSMRLARQLELLAMGWQGVCSGKVLGSIHYTPTISRYAA
jgi:GNAT superfamily N-acetyltransferase